MNGASIDQPIAIKSCGIYMHVNASKENEFHIQLKCFICHLIYVQLEDDDAGDSHFQRGMSCNCLVKL